MDLYLYCGRTQFAPTVLQNEIIFGRLSIIEENTFENYLKELEKIPPLSPDEETALAQRVSDGDEDACTRYTEGNLSLVVDIVREYEPFVKKLNILDLIQAGNLGLMKAVEKFDYTNDCSFSEYAVPFIRQSIIDAIAQ